MNRSIFYSVLIGVLLVGSSALAEENKDVDTSTKTPTSQSVRIQMKKQEDLLREKAKNVEINLKTKTEDARELIKKEAETTRERLKKEAEVVKEDVKKQREELIEAVKIQKEKLKDEIEAKREELKTRLEAVKDGRKKETVERIDVRIDALNERMMKHFSDVLDKLGEMLVRINERADKASSERGLDVSAVRLAMEKANTAITSARSAIETQSVKTYSIKITTEDSLRTDVGKTRKAFGDDLARVRDAVKYAHSAVKDAAVALAQLVIKPKVSTSPSPDSTILPQATPTE